MQSHSLEIFARVDHSSGLFWKGYAGGGLLTQGNLQDEDFPPVITPYSSTNSTLQNQSLGYISFDFGGALLRGSDFRVDGFVGYHYLHWRMKAFGCQQTATNPDICTGGIPTSVAAIVEDDTWQALRVGLNADVPLVDRWRLNLEARLSALCLVLRHRQSPVAARSAVSHVSETAMAGATSSRRCSPTRWTTPSASGSAAATGTWRAAATRISRMLGGFPQPLDFKTNIYGVFLQGSYRFGPF